MADQEDIGLLALVPALASVLRGFEKVCISRTKSVGLRYDMTKPGEVTPSIHPYTTMEAFEADRNNKSAAMETASNNLTYQQAFGTITMEGVTFPLPSDSDASDRHAQKQQQQRQPSLQEDETAPPAKRIRRVGKLTPRKVSGGAAAMQPGSVANGLATSLSLSALATANSRVLSKHDEKWNEMFTKLLAYKVSVTSRKQSN